MARRISKNDVPLTTAQRLGSLVKSARDIMRKDKGLNGDLDRLPMLTWLMFLKFLDDHEQVREERAKMKREKYRSAIEAPYRFLFPSPSADGNRLLALTNDGTSQPAILDLITRRAEGIPCDPGTKRVAPFSTRNSSIIRMKPTIGQPRRSSLKST